MKNKDILSFLKPYLMKEKKYISLAIIFALISSLINLTYGYLSGYALNAASEKVFKVAIITILINLFFSSLNYLVFSRQSNIISSKTSLNIMEDINSSLFLKVLSLPTKAFEEKSSGEFINRITSDTETITDAISTLLSVVLKILTSLLVFIYVLFNSKLVCFEIIIYIFILFKISSKYRPILKKQQKEIREQNDKYVSHVNESILGIREIKIIDLNKITML